MNLLGSSLVPLAAMVVALSLAWILVGVLAVSGTRQRARQPVHRPSDETDGGATSFLARVLEPTTRWKRRFGSSEAIETAMSSFADAIANALGAGASLHQAVFDAAETVGGQIGSEIEVVRRRMLSGWTFDEALASWPRTDSSDGARMIVSVCSMSQNIGGPSASSFRACADALRQKQQLDNDIRGASAQAKASGVMLAVLPFGAGVLMSLLDPAVGRLLFASPVGWSLIGAGIALDLAGLRWMMRMVREIR